MSVANANNRLGRFGRYRVGVHCALSTDVCIYDVMCNLYLCMYLGLGSGSFSSPVGSGPCQWEWRVEFFVAIRVRFPMTAERDGGWAGCCNYSILHPNAIS